MIQYLGSVRLDINKPTAKKKTSFKNFSVCPISPILSIKESTQFFTYGTILRICTFGYQQINSKNIQLWKFFSVSNFSNFVNLLMYAVFHLWYDIKDLYIWKSTNQQQRIQLYNFFSVSNSPILSIYKSTRFFTYGTIFRICTFGNQLINSKKIKL